MVLKRTADLIYTFRFLKLLTTKFEDTPAYELGIIDKNGKRDKSVRLDNSEKKNSYTAFHRLVFNLKKIINKAPGSGKLASYISALYLIKEHYDVNLNKILEASHVDPRDIMLENSSWFILEDGTLAPGVYRVRSEKLLNDTLDDIVNEKDQIKIHDGKPIGECLGIDIYEATHIKTQKRVYVTIGELYK